MIDERTASKKIESEPRQKVEYDKATAEAKLSWDALEKYALTENLGGRKIPEDKISQIVTSLFASDGITAEGYHAISNSTGRPGVNINSSLGRICRDSYPATAWGDAGFGIMRNAAYELCKADNVQSVASEPFKNTLKIMNLFAREGEHTLAKYAQLYVLVAGVIAQSELQGSNDMIEGKFKSGAVGDILRKKVHEIWTEIDKGPDNANQATSDRSLHRLTTLMLAAQTSMHPEYLSHLSRAFLYASMRLHVDAPLPESFRNVTELLNKPDGKETRECRPETVGDLKDYTMTVNSRNELANSALTDIKSRIEIVQNAYRLATGKTSEDSYDELIQVISDYNPRIEEINRQTHKASIREEEKTIDEALEKRRLQKQQEIEEERKRQQAIIHERIIDMEM